MAALVKLSPEKMVEEIRLALGSVGPRVMLFPDLEQTLQGRPFTYQTLNSVKSMIEDSIEPMDDLRASTEYLRMVSASLLLRLVTPCLLCGC